MVYPTLTLLEELGYVTVSTADGARKLHTITDTGHSFLADNREATDALLARTCPAPGRTPAADRAAPSTTSRWLHACAWRVGRRPTHAAYELPSAACRNF